MDPRVKHLVPWLREMARLVRKIRKLKEKRGRRKRKRKGGKRKQGVLVAELRRVRVFL